MCGGRGREGGAGFFVLHSDWFPSNDMGMQGYERSRVRRTRETLQQTHVQRDDGKSHNGCGGGGVWRGEEGEGEVERGWWWCCSQVLKEDSCMC